MFRSIFNFISTTFNRGAQLVDTAGKSVDILSTYVDAAATKSELVTIERFATEASEELRQFQVRLDADENVREIYNGIKAKFEKKKPQPAKADKSTQKQRSR